MPERGIFQGSALASIASRNGSISLRYNLFVKGVVLAGGLGTRLYPLTKITNKHLLPVYKRPMVLYPLMKMAEAGIRDVLLVTGGQHAGDFLRLLGSGKELGLRLAYTYQEGEGGIADALSLAEDFSGGEPLVVILGDNLFQEPLGPFVEKYPGRGAMILLAEVPDPERFGVPVIEDGVIKRIVEKPKEPPSRFAVTGIYFYDERVFDVIRGLSPSERGELEITDVNNWYIERGEMRHEFLSGWWTDAGTFESLFRASVLVREMELGR